jgi:hypothetical protein
MPFPNARVGIVIAKRIGNILIVDVGKRPRFEHHLPIAADASFRF